MAVGESGIGPQLVGIETGFFFQFAEGCLLFGFTRIQMPLGEIPSLGMLHQEELQGTLPAEDQVTA
jgi:hypothetical protein